mmetsp:Transcript_109709/g.354212  ORF Transcript_109709/g.354212 Transcript_109709/m.354212 type:complete len:454 (-) Transcript_109709:282-1643(-)
MGGGSAEDGAAVKREPKDRSKEDDEGKKDKAKNSKAARNDDRKDTRKGFARSPKDHYCFQVALINQVVKGPWKRVFGNLGTGFIGVCPDTPGRARSPSDDGDDGGDDGADEGDADGQGEAEAEAEAEGAAGSKAAGRKKKPADAEAGGTGGGWKLPADTTIVIFVNAPAAPLQNRGGKTIDGYKDALDRSGRTLEWSAQRSDRNNRRMETIMKHRRNGGRVVVGVRSPSSKQFSLLGEVSRIDFFQRAHFLVQNGDHIIQERGTRTFHKEITAACLNMGLRSGVGLIASRYPLSGTQAVKWCNACCYAPPKALLHFGELQDDGVEAFETEPAWLKRERKAKMEAKTETKRELQAVTKRERVEGDAQASSSSGPAAGDPPPAKEAPAKRLRCKQPLVKEERSEVRVKAERQEDFVPPSQEAAQQEGRRSSGGVKREPHEDPSVDAFGYSSVVAS